VLGTATSAKNEKQTALMKKLTLPHSLKAVKTTTDTDTASATTDIDKMQV